MSPFGPFSAICHLPSAIAANSTSPTGPTTTNAIATPAALPSPLGEGQAEGEQITLPEAIPQIENQNSKIENPPAGLPLPTGEGRGEGNAHVQDAAPAPPAPIENQKSKIENPVAPPSAGHCRCCKILLPPLLKNGERALPVCPKCGNGLYPPPPWTRVDYPWPNGYPSACDLCRQRHQLDPNGLPDPCSQCGYSQVTPKT